MNQTKSDDSPTAMGPRDDGENVRRRVEGGLEVVLKSGGVYCFVSRKPTRVEVSPPAGDTGDERGLISVTS